MTVKLTSTETVRENGTEEKARVIKNEYAYDELFRLTEETINIAEEVPFTETLTVSGDGSISLSEDITYDGKLKNTYTYDAVSNRTSKDTQISGDISSYTKDIKTGKTEYTYDSHNRLLKSTNGGKIITYAYDYEGNRISKQVQDLQIWKGEI